MICPSCLGEHDSLNSVTRLDGETPICHECRMTEELFALVCPQLPLPSFEDRIEAEKALAEGASE